MSYGSWATVFFKMEDGLKGWDGMGWDGMGQGGGG